MLNANQWIDIFKQQKGFISDYQLAQYWQIEPTIIRQYRIGKMRIPIAKCLEIAESGHYHPLEVILSLEYPKAKSDHKERICAVYWQALMVNAPKRMCASSVGGKWRKKY